MILKRLTDPEASCGSQFTILPNGSHVWIAVGPAAAAWQSIRGDVGKIVEGDRYVNVDIRVHFFMIGRSLAMASPYIMFFSDDAAARKELRKEVRQSSVLKDLPWIRLGDASPLLQPSHHRHATMADEPVREGHRKEAQQQRALTIQSRPQTPAISEINHGDHHTQHARSVNHLAGSLKAWSFSTSGSWRDSHHSGASIRSSASTRRTSVDTNTEQSRSDTSTVKGEDCESAGEQSSDEGDDFSDSGGSDELSPLPVKETFAATLPSVVRQLLEAFQAHRQSRPHYDPEDTCDVSGSHQSGGRIQGSGNRDKGKKRALDSGKNIMRGSNDEPPQSDVGKKRRRTNERGRVLACPFWKKDQGRFSRCYTHDHKEVKHVKQHLNRAHRSPFRCNRCQQTFNAEAPLAAHQRSAEVCIVQDVAHGDEISLEQRELLKKRGPPGSTQEEQWYIVWDIVFPGCGRPSSPYIDGNLSKDISEFREFYTKEGVEIVRQRLIESRHCVDRDDQGIQQRELNIVLSKALEAIYKSWIAQRPQSQDEESSGSQSKPGDNGEGMEEDICLESPNIESPRLEFAGPSGSTMDECIAPHGNAAGEAAPGPSTMPAVADGGINYSELEHFFIDWEKQTDGSGPNVDYGEF